MVNLQIINKDMNPFVWVLYTLVIGSLAHWIGVQLNAQSTSEYRISHLILDLNKANFEGIESIQRQHRHVSDISYYENKVLWPRVVTWINRSDCSCYVITVSATVLVLKVKCSFVAYMAYQQVIVLPPTHMVCTRIKEVFCDSMPFLWQIFTKSAYSNFSNCTRPIFLIICILVICTNSTNMTSNWIDKKHFQHKHYVAICFHWNYRGSMIWENWIGWDFALMKCTFNTNW